MNGDCTMVARFVPQPSSQFSKFGLMMREAPTAAAANVALLISPEAGRNVEAPGWLAQLTVRKSAGEASTVSAASDNFSEPVVTFSRLTGYCWLKLERAGDTFTGSISANGKTWTQVGAATIALKKKLLVGLPVSSCLAGITTTVMFDNVTVTNLASKINVRVANQIESPDGKVVVKFFGETGGIPTYSVNYLGKPIVLESRLGLLPDFTEGFATAKISENEHTGEWIQVYGER